MIVDWGFILLGLFLLVAGGEFLVRGASGLALLARITPAVIGLTIVAAGTSMPELVVSIQAALQGNPGLSMGNVIGSNIFNVGAIVGITALVQVLSIQSNSIRMEWPIMMLASFQLFLLSRDGLLDRVEGSFLSASLVIFVAFAVWLGKRDGALVVEAAQTEVATASFGRKGGMAIFFNLFAVACGVGLLASGSTALVRGAAHLAAELGVSDTIIGLTIVAAGTSTPELITSLVAVRRGQDDIAVGNVIGSNIFNILGIAGATAVIQPLTVSDEILGRDMWWMLGFSALLFPLMKSGMKITRGEGAILAVLFVTYTGLLVRAATGG